jgi:hypothetical protein
MYRPDLLVTGFLAGRRFAAFLATFLLATLFFAAILSSLPEAY